MTVNIPYLMIGLDNDISEMCLITLTKYVRLESSGHMNRLLYLIIT